MNKTIQYPIDKLAKLLQGTKIATMAELKEALGTQVDVTVFRKLKELDYRSSYSHRGSYYTLDPIAEFDELGLWSYRSVRFSRHGNLLQTVQALVDSAEAGYVAKDLEDILGVRVKDPLLKLRRKGRLDRQRISGQLVYLLADPAKQKQQLWTVRLRNGSPSSLESPTPHRSDDELMAAQVLFLCTLDEKQRRLYAGLESLKCGYGGNRRVAALLDMDEGTVGRGRQELLNGDIEQRVRRTGGGCKRVEKKLRKSSNASMS